MKSGITKFEVISLIAVVVTIGIGLYLWWVNPIIAH